MNDYAGEIPEIERRDQEHGVFYLRFAVKDLGMIKRWLAYGIRYLHYLVFTLLMLVAPAHAWTTIGFNFRFSTDFVTDGANEYPVTGNTYPTTFGAVTAGWTAPLSDGTRDRNAANDRRLAGSNKATNASPRTFEVDVDEVGVYQVCMAMGDSGSDHATGPQYVEIYDGDTLSYTINDTNGTLSDHFDDAFGTDRTLAAWPSANQCRGYMIHNGSIKFKFGKGTGNGDTTIAHISITKGGEESPPTTTTSSTTTTTLPDLPGNFATIEDYCPGGSNPRSSIQWCVNFENLNNCITGQESQCVTDNGLDELLVSNSKGFKIGHSPDTAGVGIGSSFGTGDASGTSPGYGSKAITGNPRIVNYRGMVKFRDGFMQPMLNTGNHGPALVFNLGVADDQPDCAGYISWDWTNSNFRVIVEINKSTACGTNKPSSGSFNLVSNIGDFQPKNNKWYTWEIRAKLNDTATTDQSDGGDGIIEYFIDGVKIMSYTNVNMIGVTPTDGFKQAFLMRGYQGSGVLRGEPLTEYDAFVLDATGTYIGVSPNKNLAGAGDSSTPVFYAVAGDGYEGRKLANDCTANGTTTGYSTANEAWRDGSVTFVNGGQNNYPCTSSCVASGCTTNRALKSRALVTGHGAGVVYYLTGIGSNNHRLVIHSGIKLPDTNDHSTVWPLSGFARYDADGMGGSNWANYLGLTVHNGKWALAQREQGDVKTPIDSTTDVTFNTWHNFELHLTDSNTVTLYMDDVKIIDAVTPDISAGTWMFDNVNPGNQSVVIGIIDGAPDTTSYVLNDDTDIGGASFMNCLGWGTSCPYHTTPVSTGTTAAPSTNFILRKKRKERI